MDMALERPSLSAMCLMTPGERPEIITLKFGCAGMEGNAASWLQNVDHFDHGQSLQAPAATKMLEEYYCVVSVNRTLFWMKCAGNFKNSHKCTGNPNSRLLDYEGLF